MAARNGDARALRTAGLVLGLVGAVLGFAVAFGVWGVGYCGAFTPGYRRARERYGATSAREPAVT